MRLDKEVQWTLEPQEEGIPREPLPERGGAPWAAEAQASAALEKLEQCPALPQGGKPGAGYLQVRDDAAEDRRPPEPTSTPRCAGHDSHLTQLVLTQSCHDKTTNDTCDFTLTMDSWLTQEEIAGVADVTAFRTAYLKKLGFDDPNSQMLKQVRQFLAPYQDSLKQLVVRATEFKGYPLKTDIRIAFGGAQCAAAKNAPPGGTDGNAVGDASKAASDAGGEFRLGAAGSRPDRRRATPRVTVSGFGSWAPPPAPSAASSPAAFVREEDPEHTPRPRSTVPRGGAEHDPGRADHSADLSDHARTGPGGAV